MATSPEPLAGGYDVDENAIRFSNYFHVLRELVHLGCGWLALEPRLEVKYALGDHLHDDARAVTKIRRRLYELRTPSDYPGAPDEALALLPPSLRVAAGSGAELLAAAGARQGRSVAATLPELQPSAAALAEIAAASRETSPALRPLYLRPPDARPQAQAVSRR